MYIPYGFAMLMADMEGYEIDIKSDIHRKNLIKDSRFYNLRHLTESLIPAHVYHNPFRGNSAEILISINDFRATNSRIGWVEGHPFGWMEYKRPHEIDKEPRDLVIQIDDDGIIVGGGKIVLINRQAVKPVKTLKEAADGRKSETYVQTLMGGRQEVAIRIEVPNECYCVFDGEETSPRVFDSTTPGNGEDLTKKRKLSESVTTGSTESTTPAILVPKLHILKRSMWRVKVRGQPSPPSQEGKTLQLPNQPGGGARRSLVLVAVKLEGWTGEREFSKEISWL
jgi:hypothetical protein